MSVPIILAGLAIGATFFNVGFAAGRHWFAFRERRAPGSEFADGRPMSGDEAFAFAFGWLEGEERTQFFRDWAASDWAAIRGAMATVYPWMEGEAP